MRNATKLMFVGAAAASLALGCSSEPKTKDTTPPPTTGPATVTPEDQAFDDMEPVALTGVRFKPEALEAPAMPMVKPKKRTSLAKQRALVAKQRKKKAQDVQVLASMLWDAADAEAEAEAKPLREEARKVLGDYVTSLGDKADQLSLSMAVAADMWAQDEATATARYEKLVSRFPKAKAINAYKTWLAYLYLRADRNADAAALVEGWDPEADTVSALSAYVIAWVRFRAGDGPGSRAAIAAAGAKWKSSAGVPALERDVMLMFTRGDATAQEAVEAVKAVAKSAPAAVLLYHLHEGFVFAGHYDRANEVLDILAADAIPTDLVSFRFFQSDYEFRQNHPLEAAERATAAFTALKDCSECQQATIDAVYKRIQDLARFFHTVYAASFDESHGKAAKVLYTLYVDNNLPDADTVRGYLHNLEQTMAAASAQNGKYDKQVMQSLVKVRLDGVKACYESALGAEPDLAGQFTLTLDIDASGAVEGVSSEPAAGKQGLAGVAACAAGVVKQWRFPTRTVPGRTALVVPIKLSAP